MEAIQDFYIENNQIKGLEEWKDDGEKEIIYEVLRIIKCKPLFYEEHYKRMVNSCSLAEVKLEFSEDTIKELIEKLIKANKSIEGNIKITYGKESKKIKMFYIKHSYPSEEMYSEGVRTILYYGERENPNAKIVNQNFRSKVNEKLKETGAYEAILVDRNNLITEGSRSNIFFIKGDAIYTSKVEKVLPGVTRTEIIKLANENNINVLEGEIDAKDLMEFDAMFISGTSPQILPISKVEDIKFDTNNYLLRKLMELFLKKVEKY
ncbi:aminotransferase class IV [Clostridium sp. SHJSY1]|uniref:aminotransferase class IV n=1 Tax=Clostridium sp. SHJSY1 TaxID=2942483 RepID=UPI002874E974|nr:aminotransferase class IV [Clostridium sp. SHJSY1]MDS0524138.1 aminotransferase class IV [Clostridium sp. SHJSY1]